VLIGGSLDGRDELLEAIHALWLIEDIDDFGPAVLQAITQLVPADLASYNEVDPSADRALVIGHPRQPTAAELRPWQRWAYQNPCIGHIVRTGDGSPKRISDFLSQAEFHCLELYSEVYAPLGIEYQAGFSLAAPAPLVIGVAFNRETADFADEELKVLNTLRPHLIQAYRNVQLLSSRRLALDSVAGFLRGDGQAFHVVGGPIEDPVAEVLGGFFGDSHGFLPQPVEEWLEAERTAFMTTSTDRLREPFVVRTEAHRLTIQYVPAAQGLELLWLHEQQIGDDVLSLQRLGLSQREAQVLWLLTQGLATKEIALKANISTLTVKKHLEHIYQKLGVSGRTGAVALAVGALTT
jgi:DNA-binding CsgD family transcriptional regulator